MRTVKMFSRNKITKKSELVKLNSRINNFFIVTISQFEQLEHTYSSYVRIRDVPLKTSQRRWTIGRSGERGSEKSVLAARHDDDDDDYFIFGSNLVYFFKCLSTLRRLYNAKISFVLNYYNNYIFNVPLHYLIAFFCFYLFVHTQVYQIFLFNISNFHPVGGP